MTLAYLDYAATTPLHPEVAAAMAEATGGADGFGNPSGSHAIARRARRALEEARDEVAELLGCRPREVVFTSGGTEAANLGVLGPLAALVQRGRPAGAVVHSAVEHPAVLEAARAAERSGAALFGAAGAARREVGVGADGVLDLEALRHSLGPDVSVVSVMLANNEVGTVQPLAQAAALVRRHAPQAVLHTDAVQAAVHLDLVGAAACADLVSVSAHKLGGPKGSGALVVREHVSLGALVFGGGQEGERRSGTQDVAGAVGLAAALRVTAQRRETEGARVRALRDRLADGLRSSVAGVTESAPRAAVLPGHCHVRFGGVDREELLVLLDREGVCASGGAACASGALEPSHVLRAMGVADDDARGAVRFTLGWRSGRADVDHVLAVVPPAVAALRERGAVGTFGPAAAVGR